MNHFSGTENETLQSPLGPSAGGMDSSEPGLWAWNPEPQFGAQVQAPVDPGGPGRRGGLIRRVLSPLVVIAAVSGLIASGTTYVVTTAGKTRPSRRMVSSSAWQSAMVRPQGFSL